MGRRGDEEGEREEPRGGQGEERVEREEEARGTPRRAWRRRGDAAR